MRKKNFRIILTVLIFLIVLGAVTVLGVNSYVKYVGGKYIMEPNEVNDLDNVDCAVVLGCQVINGEKASDMLADRIRRGIELYKSNAIPKIIMSGDHGTKEYDEVNTMKRIAVMNDVPSRDIFMDHAGFSTYESMYRAKEIFEADKIVVVTQKYHLYRALYIARMLGIEAYGVASDYHVYMGQRNRDVREVLARCKDFVKVIFKPKPTYLGDSIPVSGNGNKTND